MAKQKMPKKNTISIASMPDIPQQKEDEKIGVEHGTVGTDIFSGYIDVDYNTRWRTLAAKVATVKEMMGSDGSIEAILMAMKNPIMSLKFFIEPCDESEEERQIAEFVGRNIFEEIEGGFDWFLEQGLTQYEYGFSVFEKVYKEKEGMIALHKLAFREQESIEKWGIDGMGWVDGHPPGITQTLKTTDEVKDFNTTRTIPWNKLLIFSHKRKGNNFEGSSVLRPPYIHWYFKNLLYKIGGVAADRFGVGIPYIKLKNTATEKERAKYEELVKNIKSNEQAFAVFDEKVEEFNILSVQSSGQSSMMKDQIDQHDRKIYDSILAGFLNLTTGDGGSNALSKDQSSFFLRGLQRNVNYICSVMSELVKEIVYLNFGKRRKYPKFCASDVGQISMDEYVNSIKAAKEGELIKWTERDESKFREQTKLPSLPEKDEEDLEAERLESELDILELEVQSIDIGVGEGDGVSPEEKEGGEAQVAEEEEEKELNEEDLGMFFGEDLGGVVWKFVKEGGHLTDEHKKKISEALKKNKGVGDTLKKEVEGDNEYQKLAQRKESILGQIEKYRGMLEEFKNKKIGMSKKDKIAFNKAMGETIEATKRLRDGLIRGRVAINKKIKERKGQVKEVRTERKTKEKIEKAIEKEEKRREKLRQRIGGLEEDKKTAKTPEKKEKIQKKIDELEGKVEGDFDSKFNSESRITYSIRPSERERTFMRHIGDFENYLESEYSNYERVVSEAEGKLRKGITMIYESSEYELIDGQKVFSFSKKNRELQNKALTFVEQVQKQLEEKMLDNKLQDRLFDRTKKKAMQALMENKKLLEEDEDEIWIEEEQFISFIKGHKSNIGGILFNEPRRIMEKIILNYGSQVSVSLAVRQAGEIAFNRNILKLSTVTHARGAYNAIQYNGHVQQGFTQFKPVVPKQRLKDVSSSGMTASLLFKVLTAAEINRQINKKTEGETTDALTGLNLHHGAYMYFYPISNDDMEEEMELSKEQRENFLDNVEVE